MSKAKILGTLRESIVTLDEDAARTAATEVISSGIDPLEAVLNAVAVGLEEIGNKFEKMEYFLPELMRGADTARAAIKILESAMPTESKYHIGTVVIGTIEGDVHDIGKNIVSSMLQVIGFDVYDLGKSVPAQFFVQNANEKKAEIIAVSALMTTTMPGMQRVIEWAVTKGQRNSYKIMIGGGSVTQEFARQIGADGYARNAAGAANLAKELLMKGEEGFRK